ncbi:MAG: hypothetical protein GY876_10920 [Planctomycetes bacterium]|nr:hypothetical protein [Planctomycetota bacterium]
MPFTQSTLCLAILTSLASATPWPAGPEIAIDIDDASNNLSGATWNPVTETLWVVRQNGQLWEFAYDEIAGSFELERFVSLPSGVGSDIEACMQVDQLATNELYALDENTGIVSRAIDLGGSPSVLRSWDLSAPNNGHTMPDEQGGAGPEAIEFATDSALLAAGFRLPDGSGFTGSTKGMGGLIFVGHQIDGRLHVFDVNPDVSNDFINYGSFLTSATEIAGLHFDRASGLMYIWHNPSNINSLEVTTLSSDTTAGVIDSVAVYDSDMPEGNTEGIALTGQGACGDHGADPEAQVLFLTRDGGTPNLGSFNSYPCSSSGACCVVTGCDVVTEASCENFGGIWLGDATSCDNCPSPACLGDLDNSGDVNVTDLLMMLESWGPCV